MACARCRSGSRSASVRSSGRSRRCVSCRCRSSSIRSSCSGCRCSVSGRSRSSSSVACRSSSLVARLVASGESQSSQHGSEEEGFLHDHVLLWIKVSNSANVTGNVYVLTPTLSAGVGEHRMCPIYQRLGPKLYALSYWESIYLPSRTNLSPRAFYSFTNICKILETVPIFVDQQISGRSYPACTIPFV